MLENTVSRSSKPQNFVYMKKDFPKNKKLFNCKLKLVLIGADDPTFQEPEGKKKSL